MPWGFSALLNATVGLFLKGGECGQPRPLRAEAAPGPVEGVRIGLPNRESAEPGVPAVQAGG